MPTLINSFSLSSTVGIGTDFPNKALTVVGDVSATNNIYANSIIGDGSGLTGLYNGSDVKALSGNWQSTYTTVTSNSANWNAAFNSSTAYQNASGSFAISQFFLPLSGGSLTGNLLAPALSSNYIFGTGSETVLSDGLGNNDLGNGANTLSLNFSGGVFVGGNGTINTPSITTNTINTTPINSSFISVPSVVYLTANLANTITAIASFGLSTFTLQPNGIYELLYNIYYVKNTTNTVTYTLSGSNNFSLVNGEAVQTINSGSTAFSAPTKSYINNTGGTNIAAFPVTATLTSGATHTATIRFFIINSANTNTIQLAITNNTSGTVTPLAGSYAKLTRIG